MQNINPSIAGAQQTINKSLADIFHRSKNVENRTFAPHPLCYQPLIMYYKTHAFGDISREYMYTVVHKYLDTLF